MTGARVELSDRDRAILRAVAAGEGELTRSCEPDLYLEGRCCSDQVAVHRLTHAGLITTTATTATAITSATASAAAGHRTPARLTPAGHQLVHTAVATDQGVRR